MNSGPSSEAPIRPDRSAPECRPNLSVGFAEVGTREPAVDVVIVTHNASQVIDACLEPLMDDERLSIIVVDNDSTDDTLERVERFSVRVIQSGSNLGFGVASNLGAAIGSSQQILFLNPDTIADPRDIEAAATYARTQRIGVLGCRLVTLGGELDHAARRNVVRPWVAAKYLIARSKRSKYLAPETNEFEPAQVDAVNGAFMLIERATFTEVGGFDEDYWMYMEDIDLCLRVKNTGRSVVYWPGVTVTHIKSGITGRSRSPRLNYHFYRSLAVFYRKHQAQEDQLPLRVLTIGGVWTFYGFAVLRDTWRRRRGAGMPYLRQGS